MVADKAFGKSRRLQLAFSCAADEITVARTKIYVNNRRL
ncbi:Uncharacterised protein [uncultured archaeon]|nr:Uncharacterised protein [uncultured archaeon]